MESILVEATVVAGWLARMERDGESADWWREGLDAGGQKLELSVKSKVEEAAVTKAIEEETVAMTWPGGNDSLETTR